MAPAGLETGVVRLAPFSDEWPKLYERERARIAEALGDSLDRIEHVGSTSVHALIAKPIVDIAAQVTADTARGDFVARFVAIGYLDRGDQGRDGGHLLGLESAPRIRTHHLHVVYPGDGNWDDYMAFRSRLRSDPEARRRYAEPKLELAERFADDRPGYTLAKAAFIQSLLR